MADTRSDPLTPAANPEGPWLDWPEERYRRHAGVVDLDQGMKADAEAFRRDGYLVKDFGFSNADLDAAAAYTRRLPAGRGRVQDGWMVEPAIGRIASHPAVQEYLGALYGRAAFPFQTLNFMRGSEQSPHSDAFFFSSKPAGFMCGVWVALEDIHAGSGPLVYFAGSHRVAAARVDGDYDDAKAAEVVAELGRAGIASQTALIRRGQAFIWAANLVHGGCAIEDPEQTRLSQVTHYYFQGCSYFSPLASDSALGRVFWREPYDIAARRFVKNAGPGETPRLRYRLGQRLRLWARKPFIE